MNQILKLNWRKFYFAIVFGYFVFLRFLVIPAGDDYFWGGAPGKYLLHHGFYGPKSIYGGSSNGRYLGNLLEIFTIHHLWAAMLMYGIFGTLLVWCLWQLLGKSDLSLFLSSLFIFTLQVGYMSTVLAWNAGFVNYVPPIVLSLLYLVIVQKYFDNKRIPKKSLIWIAFILSLSGGLFVEHMNLYQVVVGILVIIITSLVYKKKLPLFEISYLVGAVISSLIMFSHPAYHEHSTYRDTSLNLHLIVTNYFKITHFWFNTLNLLVNVVICVMIMILSIKLLKKKYLTVIAGMFTIYYLVINLWITFQGYNQYFIYKRLNLQVSLVDGFMTILFWIFLIYSLFKFFDWKKDFLVYLSMISYFLLIIPFIVITSPINPREFFESYVYIYLFACLLILRTSKLFEASYIRQGIILVSLIVVLCGINLGYKMTQNYQVNLSRVQNEAFLVGNKPLNKHVPYREYVLSNDSLIQQSSSYWHDYLNKDWLQRLK